MSSTVTKPTTEARLRRLERLAALAFVERHGVAVDGGAVIGGVRRMRRTAAVDVHAILAEHREHEDEE
jgi:hypothetical protein